MKKIKMFKNCIRLTAILVFAVYFSSCRNFLSVDEYFNDEFKLDSIFANKRYVEAYMWGIAAAFPDEGRLVQDACTPGPVATDEAFTMHAGRMGIDFVTGEINADNLKSLNIWGDRYKIIRKCNIIFKNIDKVSDFTAVERLRILGYTRFIRAYAYYQLLVDFGPPILMGDDIMETNERIEYYDRSRSTYDEAVEYVCSELEEAAKYMPATLPHVDFGRPTKGAAYGLVARLRLIHASPLFNGGQAARTYFGSWTRKTDGKHYVSQVYDEKRWAVAAAAAKRVMEMTNAGAPMYGLYTAEADSHTPALPVNVTSDPNYYQAYPNGASGIDHYRSYSEIFNGEAVMTVNPEYVWARKSSGVETDLKNAFPLSLGGWNSQCITQKVVDAYRMIDGRAIDNSSVDYPYSETGFTTSVKNFSGYRLNADVSNMYVNREARFYASVAFTECYWTCSSSTSAGTYNQTVSYYYESSNGKSGPPNPIDFPITGYNYRKTVHPQDAFTSTTGARRIQKAFAIIRYAEILLSYAEALNNLAGSHTVDIDGESRTFSRDINEIAKNFNMVRYRAGLPGLSADELADPQKIQKLIEQERMIEFLYENRRYYDVRRWGIYEESEKASIMGMNTDAGKTGYYQRVVPNTSKIGKRIVNKRLVFVPVPRNELKRLPSVDQNPGWD